MKSGRRFICLGMLARANEIVRELFRIDEYTCILLKNHRKI